MNPVLRVTGTRYESGLNGSPPFTRYEVAPGVWLTVFDDGRTRVRMDPTDTHDVKVKTKDTTYPGTKILARVRKAGT